MQSQLSRNRQTRQLEYMTDALVGYDDEAAIAYVRNQLPQELKEKLSDDDIVYITDLIYDYYESRGMLSEDVDEDEVFEFDEEDLLDYVEKSARKEGVVQLERDDLCFVVMAELDYEDSFGVFDTPGA